RAARPLAQRVDPLHGVLDLVVVKVGTNDVKNFVIPQRGTSFLWVEAPANGGNAAGRGQKGQAGILPTALSSKSRAKAAAGSGKGKVGRRQPIRPKSSSCGPRLPSL